MANSTVLFICISEHFSKLFTIVKQKSGKCCMTVAMDIMVGLVSIPNPNFGASAQFPNPHSRCRFLTNVPNCICLHIINNTSILDNVEIDFVPSKHHRGDVEHVNPTVRSSKYARGRVVVVPNIGDRPIKYHCLVFA